MKPKQIPSPDALILYLHHPHHTITSITTITTSPSPHHLHHQHHHINNIPSHPSPSSPPVFRVSVISRAKNYANLGAQKQNHATPLNTCIYPILPLPISNIIFQSPSALTQLIMTLFNEGLLIIVSSRLDLLGCTLGLVTVYQR